MAECDELNSEARNICLIANNVGETIDHEYQSVVSQVSIETGPFAGQKTNRIKLGPFFKPEFVKELLPSLCGYPDTPSLPPFIYSPNELACPWTKDTTKPLAGWTTCHDTLDWFNRLSSRHEKWKSQRIYEFLKLSTHRGFPFDGVLSASLLSCWNPCLNVFITGQGPMTVTLEDIAYITGLSPSGIELPYHKHVEGALDITNILFRKSDAKVVSTLSFSYFISMYKGGKDEEVTREEEILFINFSLCKMLMAPSLNIYRRFLLLAANIEASPADKPLSLAPFLLAQFYRCMYKLRTTNTLVNARGGPLWLLTFWGFLYFPSLVSIKSPEAITNDVCTSPSSACCYGEVATLLLSVPSGKPAADILSALLEPSPLAGPNKVNWHPCSAKDEMDGPLDSFSSWAKFAVPQWLRETNPVMYKSEDSAHWQSILVQRDLLYVGPHTIGVEVYNPNLAARQFGLIQACAVPLYQTRNRPWGSRLDFLVGYKKDKKLEWKYKTEKYLTSSHTFKITDFNVQPWVRCADVDDGFSIWWDDFWNRHQKAKTLITSQQILIKALDKNRFKSNTLDTTPSSIGNRKETEAAKGHSPEMATRTSIPDNRISPSASYIPQLKVDPNMETSNKKVAEEEEDDIMPLRRLKRRKKKGVNDLTPVSLDNPGKQGRIAESRENIEANEDPSMLSMIVVSYVETPIQSVFPISSSSMLPETTTEPLMTENIDNTPLNGPNNISLNVTEEFTPEHRNQHEVAEACDSVEAFGNISARIGHVLKALSHDPSHNISRLESKKASLLDTLEELVNNPKSFDSFDALMGLAQEFTGLAPASYQSTMDHLKKSITSIQDVSYKLKTQGPQILSSLEKKHSMKRQRLEVEKKFDEVHTLWKTHVYICTEVAFLEAELMKLERERDAVEEQLADVDNELASLSHQLEDSVAALENEADWLAKAESIRKSWDLDMKVFKSAIVGIIKQLQSF